MAAFIADDFNAASYKSYRPDYAQSLYDTILEYHGRSERDLALDVATGTGQAALRLVEEFKKVIAIDASNAMLGNAQKHERIDYRFGTAEKLPIDDESVDFISVAQAAHWFDMPAFYKEAKRVLKPNGTLAIWGYRNAYVTNFDAETNEYLSSLLENHVHVTLGIFWDRGREKLDRMYADDEFKMDGIFDCTQRVLSPLPESQSAPSTPFMHRSWNADRIGDYLKTWSAYKHFLERSQSSEDPVDTLVARIEARVGNARIDLIWPVVLMLGRK